MTVVPNTIALATIADGALEVAVDHRNNYAAIQAQGNGLVADLSGGSAGQVLKALSSSAVAWASTPLITTSTMAGGPPGSPADGDIWIATAVDANGTRWQFQYNAGSGSASKWEFIGGRPVLVEVTAAENTASGGYVALTTAGPAITLARAGDYDVAIGATMYNNTNNCGSRMSYDIGGTAAVDADNVLFDQSPTTNSSGVSAYRPRPKTGLAAATTLTAKYRIANGGTGTFQYRWMSVTPVRIA